MIDYEYLVCNEYGDVLFSYYNEDDALTRVYSREEYSISRQPIKKKEKKMSRTTDYILEKEEEGELIYDVSRGEYLSPYRKELSDEVEYLEWDISRSKAALKEKIKEFTRSKV